MEGLFSCEENKFLRKMSKEKISENIEIATNFEALKLG